jgi:hypothetical protein
LLVWLATDFALKWTGNAMIVFGLLVHLEQFHLEAFAWDWMRVHLMQQRELFEGELGFVEFDAEN